MLWDAIRDFFVVHVFGGCASNDVLYSGFVGRFYQPNGSYLNLSVNEVRFPFGYNSLGNQYYITIGDYLSSTATIISITIIVVLCCLFIYKIIKLIGGLIR